MFAKFSRAKATTQEYNEKFRALSFNLKDATNPDLRRRLYRGTISAEQLVTMSAQELAPSALKELRKKELQDAIDAARSDYDQAKGLGESDMFQCEKCNGWRTKFFMQQTRGTALALCTRHHAPPRATLLRLTLCLCCRRR